MKCFSQICVISSLFLVMFLHMDVNQCNDDVQKIGMNYIDIKKVINEWSCNDLVVASGSYSDLLTVYCIETGRLRDKEKTDLRSSATCHLSIPRICRYLDPYSKQNLFEDLLVIEGTHKQVELLAILFISVIYRNTTNIELITKRGKSTVLVVGQNGAKLDHQLSIGQNSYSNFYYLLKFIRCIAKIREDEQSHIQTETLLTPEWTVATLVYYFLPNEESYKTFLTSTYNFCQTLNLLTGELFGKNRDISNNYMAVLDDMVGLITETPGITKVVPLLETAEFAPSKHSYTGLKAMSYILNIFGDCDHQFFFENGNRAERIRNFLRGKAPLNIRIVYRLIYSFMNMNDNEEMDAPLLHTLLVNSVNGGEYESFAFFDDKKARLKISKTVAVQIFVNNDSISADVLGECKALTTLDERPAEYDVLKKKLLLQGKRLEYLIMCFVTDYEYQL